MLFGNPRGEWSVTCSLCLKTLGVTWATREAAIAALDEAMWELAPDMQTFCLACSRERREVQFRTNARGVRMKRRR